MEYITYKSEEEGALAITSFINSWNSFKQSLQNMKIETFKDPLSSNSPFFSPKITDDYFAFASIYQEKIWKTVFNVLSIISYLNAG